MHVTSAKFPVVTVMIATNYLHLPLWTRDLSCASKCMSSVIIVWCTSLKNLLFILQTPENSIKIKELLKELLPLVTTGAVGFDKKTLKKQMVETVLLSTLILIRARILVIGSSPPFFKAECKHLWWFFCAVKWLFEIRRSRKMGCVGDTLIMLTTLALQFQLAFSTNVLVFWN